MPHDHSDEILMLMSTSILWMLLHRDQSSTLAIHSMLQYCLGLCHAYSHWEVTNIEFWQTLNCAPVFTCVPSIVGLQCKGTAQNPTLSLNKLAEGVHLLLKVFHSQNTGFSLVVDDLTYLAEILRQCEKPTWTNGQSSDPLRHSHRSAVEQGSQNHELKIL